jgi:hypothetical protein
MGNDALAQWYQVNGILPVDDWHPALIVHIWRIVNMLIPGPAGMLILQQAAYWLGIGLLVFNMLNERPRWLKFVLLTFLGLFPVWWLATATILKDILMISSLLLATGLFSTLKVDLYRAQFWVKVLFIYGFLFLACGFRHNAVTAVAPIAFLITFWILTPYLNLWMRAAASASVVASIVICTNVTAKLGVEKRYPFLVNQILFWNLAGLSIDADSLLIPVEAFADPNSASVVTLSRYYQDQSCNMIAFDSGIIDPSVCSDEVVGKRFLDYSLTVILSKPADYLRIRWRFLKHFSGYGRWRPYGAYIFNTKYWPGDENLGLPMFTMNNAKVLDLIDEKLVSRMMVLGLYNVIPYLLLALIELLWLVRTRPLLSGSKNTLILKMLLLSGILYWLPLLIIAPSNDFRYHLWTITTTSIIGVFGLCNWLFRSNVSTELKIE